MPLTSEEADRLVGVFSEPDQRLLYEALSRSLLAGAYAAVGELMRGQELMREGQVQSPSGPEPDLFDLAERAVLTQVNQDEGLHSVEDLGRRWPQTEVVGQVIHNLIQQRRLFVQDGHLFTTLPAVPTPTTIELDRVLSPIILNDGITPHRLQQVLRMGVDPMGPDRLAHVLAHLIATHRVEMRDEDDGLYAVAAPVPGGRELPVGDLVARFDRVVADPPFETHRGVDGHVTRVEQVGVGPVRIYAPASAHTAWVLAQLRREALTLDALHARRPPYMSESGVTDAVQHLTDDMRVAVRHDPQGNSVFRAASVTPDEFEEAEEGFRPDEAAAHVRLGTRTDLRQFRRLALDYVGLVKDGRNKQALIKDLMQHFGAQVVQDGVDMLILAGALQERNGMIYLKDGGVGEEPTSALDQILLDD